MRVGDEKVRGLLSFPKTCAAAVAKGCGKSCSKSLCKTFACVRKCKQWPGSRRTPQPELAVSTRPWQGVWQGACPLAALARRLALQKQHLPVLQMLAGQVAVFVRSVFRALQLLPLQSKTHAVKTLNRF